MMISVFELFKIGIGPSSSHTVGPMKAAASFLADLGADIARTARIEVTLYGSLAWTGRGHATDRAVVLGLTGALPDTIDPEEAEKTIQTARHGHKLALPGKTIPFSWEQDLVFDCVTQPPHHPNTVQFRAYNAGGQVLREERWCSIGGGFVVREDSLAQPVAASLDVPFSFASGRDLLEIGRDNQLSIAEIIFRNEMAQRPRQEVLAHVHRIIDVMLDCIERGLRTGGELPGGLKVKRRAPSIYAQIDRKRLVNARRAHEIMDFISVFAIAVNEENAAGGRVVTAPTNGAAGVMPAVLRYYRDFCPEATRQGMETFLFTATAIGTLFKMNASISGAEVGCQGEVGVACSMSAAGLAAALGGTNEQIENAAEIGLEHHLGMTCDPVAGLVQIPCIERNAFGAVKAINAASLALHGDGTHRVSLDQVIATMRQTGADMHNKYKETSLGGLAVNYVEC